MSKGLVLIMMDVPPEMEEEFNEWYDKEHIPQYLTGVPGYLAAMRYVAVEGSPKYLTLYDLESPEVFYSRQRRYFMQNPTPWSARIVPRFFNHRRNCYEEIWSAQGQAAKEHGRGLRLVLTDVKPEGKKQYEKWLYEEHIPALLTAPGALDSRRFAAVEGEPKYAIVSNLADPSVINSDAYQKAREATAPGPDIKPFFTIRARNTYKLLSAFTREDFLQNSPVYAR